MWPTVNCNCCRPTARCRSAERSRRSAGHIRRWAAYSSRSVGSRRMAEYCCRSAASIHRWAECNRRSAVCRNYRPAARNLPEGCNCSVCRRRRRHNWAAGAGRESCRIRPNWSNYTTAACIHRRMANRPAAYIHRRKRNRPAACIRPARRCFQSIHHKGLTAGHRDTKHRAEPDCIPAAALRSNRNRQKRALNYYCTIRCKAAVRSAAARCRNRLDCNQDLSAARCNTMVACRKRRRRECPPCWRCVRRPDRAC